MAKRDYYEVLGVKRDTADKQIKQAYRRLAKKYHPDRNKGDKEAEETFKEISEAYHVLSDKKKRAQYDRFGEASAQGFGGGFWDVFTGRGRGRGEGQAATYDDLGDFGDIFSRFFRGGSSEPGAGPQRRPARGNDVVTSVSVSFEQAVKGATLRISLPINQTCSRCKGSGAEPGTSAARCAVCDGAGTVQSQQLGFAFSKPCPQCFGRGKVVTNPCTDCRGLGQTRRKRRFEVRIPRGVRNGQRIRLAGQGEPGRNGGPAGDLLVEVRVREHGAFRREGNDIHSEVTINVVQAALGTRIEAPTINGRVALTVPPGAHSGTQLRLRGRGVEPARGPKGDHYVTIRVRTPRNLTDAQKKLLKRFAQEAGLEL